jgi:hypothetical protein
MATGAGEAVSPKTVGSSRAGCEPRIIVVLLTVVDRFPCRLDRTMRAEFIAPLSAFFYASNRTQHLAGLLIVLKILCGSHSID